MTRPSHLVAAGLLAVAAALAACGDDDTADTDASTAGPAATAAPDTSPPTAAATSPPATAPATSPPTTPEPTTPPTPAPAPEFRVVTFNAGLARGFVDLAAERVPLVVDAVAELEADVVALQEVWEPADVDALVAAVEGRFAEQRFLEPAPESATAAACPPGELDALETCARTACADVAPDQLADCVLSNCGAEYAAVEGTCQTCLAANIGGSLDDVITACEVGAEQYAYGGSFGIGLLCRYPILSVDETVLDSSLNRRAVIHAVVDAGDMGTVHVFATHLSAVFADIPFPGTGTWEAEQRTQIERLLALVAERVPADEAVVLLGDLNTGPALPGIVAEVPENFELVRAAGFEAPYLDAEPSPGCTFCADNPLVGGADDDASMVIDHVLVRGLRATAVDRVLDEPVTVGATTTRLSDHYGVEATLTPP